MRSYLYSMLMFFLLFIYSCKTNVSTDLFDVEEANRKTSFESLKKQGFTKMQDVDLLIMEKRKHDTIVQLEMNTNSDVIYSKTWKIKITNFNRNNIQDFFRKKGFTLTEFNNFSDDKNSYSFSCKNKLINRFYTCKVLKELDQNYLYVTYTFNN